LGLDVDVQREMHRLRRLQGVRAGGEAREDPQRDLPVVPPVPLVAREASQECGLRRIGGVGLLNGLIQAADVEEKVPVVEARGLVRRAQLDGGLKVGLGTRVARKPAKDSSVQPRRNLYLRRPLSGRELKGLGVSLFGLPDVLPPHPPDHLPRRLLVAELRL
jgi:hypothetical protein